MNRRQFTASLAALSAAPAIPFAAAAAPAATPAVPAGAYAWAQLIARAQNQCSPALLARHLHLSSDVATSLFDQMLRDGVLRAQGLAGVAQATHPINATGANGSFSRRIAKTLHNTFEDDTARATRQSATDPMVNPDTARLGCAEPDDKEHADARANQSAEESPEKR